MKMRHKKRRPRFGVPEKFIITPEDIARMERVLFIMRERNRGFMAHLKSSFVEEGILCGPRK